MFKIIYSIINFFKKDYLCYTLSDKHPNIIFIPVYKMTRTNAEEYMKSLVDKFKKSLGEDYKKYRIFFIPKQGQ
jgi:peptidase E